MVPGPGCLCDNWYKDVASCWSDSCIYLAFLLLAALSDATPAVITVSDMWVGIHVWYCDIPCQWSAICPGQQRLLLLLL